MTQPLRALGHFESVLAECQRQLGGAGQITLAAELSGRLDESLVRAAFARLQAQHALLGATLERRPDGWWFLGGVPFAEVSLVVHRADHPLAWRQVLASEQASVLDDGGPLWRVTVLDGGDEPTTHLLLTMHHAAADGLSAFSLVKQFLGVYGQLAAGAAPALAPRPLHPPLEHLLAGRAAGRAPARALRQVRTPFEELAPLPERTTCNQFFALATEVVERLVRRCHAEQSTVNAAFLAAMARASQVVPGGPPGAQIVVPTNLRRECVPLVDDDQIGLFVYNVGTECDAPTLERPFWELAHALEARFLEQRAALVPPVEFAFADVERLVARQIDPGLREYEFGPVLSNLGSLSLPAPGAAPRLEHCHVAINNRIQPIVFLMTTVHGCLDGTVCHATPLTSEPTARQFLAALGAAVEGELAPIGRAADL